VSYCKRYIRLLATIYCLLPCTYAHAAAPSMAAIDEQISSHANQSGVYVLEKGEEALLARAWIADHAERSIDVQYFIWSTDNIGILAVESILRAADRGVKVRILVDDLMTNADENNILAVALHPNIDIRIYNPNINVGVPFYKRWFNAASQFHDVNQRMHDKTFIVDNKVAITGGRNMAAEYYDYHHDYNFRDRDALLAGVVVDSMHDNFERFWSSPLSVPVEKLLTSLEAGLTQNHNEAVNAVYEHLHNYAADVGNFAPEVRAALGKQSVFDRFVDSTKWGQVEFLHDQPGKTVSLDATASIAASLAALVDSAEKSITIQSPYLVVSAEAHDLFARAIARHVKIRISTNSLSSTDNLQAFSGYRKQRDELLKLGIEIFEYRPDASAHQQLRADELVGQVMIDDHSPTFGLHAKTLVVDDKVAFVGTFNLDPRSQNLNTEVGVLIRDEEIAATIRQSIETDMLPENSWSAATDDPDQFASTIKRAKVRLWQWLPIDSLL
jgi:putative cardiolipin synthase